ncbi:PQQ-binding-like beta-propeller repeat protein [Asanoa sp. WMMD1127]|uniref:outer membrane protein assembly factor BamB family protein n=1 Tax=Asanoa sp. WMMD1127 TaxID=3016107 RepID=UPI002415B5C3|nr:PQQ-binding-like beta-propeller repeat protein [Asanoa sp. WMMD1127]MDG4820664.1 PQQ-binding-like beta-propeller repeat protein [Asanoa sp. WMMD1127]
MTSSGNVDIWPAVGTRPAGRLDPVIEIDRDVDWQPPEPRPWSTRTRILAAGVTAAVAATVWFAGIATPNDLAPIFRRAGTAEAMALDDSRAYVSGGNAVRAYQLSDGAQLWFRRVVGLAHLIALDDDRVAIATVDVGQRPEVWVLDGRTGAVLWQRQTRYVARAGDVLVVNGPRDGDTLPLRGLATTDGTPRWTVEMEPTVMVAGVTGPLRTDQVEVLPGHLRVRDLTSGRVVVDTEQDGAISATVVNGTAILVDQQGMISAYDAGDGRRLWRQPTPVHGIFESFADCGRYLCHVNDRGTIALERLTGRRAWKADKRYLTAPVDEEHMFVAETFEGFDGSGTAVVDPRNGGVRTTTAPWRGLGVIEDSELLVWRYDGPRQQLIGLFDAVSTRTRIIGRADDWAAAPTCVTSARHVLCASVFEIAVWPR